MEDLGTRIAYTALPTGVPVYDSTGGTAGTVEHVLADEPVDVFHGLIVRTPANGHLFAAREQIGSLYERGVTLAVPAGELCDPEQDGVAAEAGTGSGPVRDGLRRAWEWLSQPH